MNKEPSFLMALYLFLKNLIQGNDENN